MKVGQKVVCINNKPKDDRPKAKEALSRLKVGDTYTIKEVVFGGGAIILVEVQSMTLADREVGFKSDRFVPLDSHQWADELLNKISEEIEEELLVS